MLSESIVVSAWIEMDTLNHKQKDNQLLIYIETILVIKSSPFNHTLQYKYKYYIEINVIILTGKLGPLKNLGFWTTVHEG